MYSGSQRLHDAFYGQKDYAEEARRLKGFIARHTRSAGNTLLDVAYAPPATCPTCVTPKG